LELLYPLAPAGWRTAWVDQRTGQEWQQMHLLASSLCCGWVRGRLQLHKCFKVLRRRGDGWCMK
jgi:hypothetical protein